MPRPATYIIDFDSTLISSESLDELARIALAGHPDHAAKVADLQKITDLGMTGQLAFDQSLDRRLELFSACDAHVARLINQLHDQVSDSMLRHQDWLRANRDRIYVISGGFEDYILPVVERLGLRLDHVFANRFVYDAAGAITGYDATSLLCKPGGKAAHVASLNLPRPIVMIGDGHTDYEVKHHGHADEFWVFIENAHREATAAKADRVIRDFGEVVAEV